MKKILVCITGGHITPAMAVAGEIRRLHPEWETVLFGRNESLEGSGVPSVESQLAHDYGMAYVAIPAGRFGRTVSFATFVSWLKVPVGLLASLWHLYRLRPAMVLSFGGYVALPVAMAARLFGIPVVTHEQTRIMGLANRIIARLARIVLLSHTDTRRVPAGVATTITGLPLRRVLFDPPRKPGFPVVPHKKILFITGGSTGSVALNAVIFATLDVLVRDYMVIHQTGGLSFSDAERVRAGLSSENQGSYLPVQYLSERDYSWVLTHAHIVVGRSGANTVAECKQFGKICIFVPLPRSAGGEQYDNALSLVRAGSSEIVEQKDFTPEVLLARLSLLEREYIKRSEAAGVVISKKADRAAERIIHMLENCL